MCRVSLTHEKPQMARVRTPKYILHVHLNWFQVMHSDSRALWRQTHHIDQVPSLYISIWNVHADLSRRWQVSYEGRQKFYSHTLILSIHRAQVIPLSYTTHGTISQDSPYSSCIFWHGNDSMAFVSLEIRLQILIPILTHRMYFSIIFPYHIRIHVLYWRHSGVLRRRMSNMC